MHDAVSTVEISESTEHSFRDLSEDVDAYGAECPRDPVQGPV
jgi:hypothetical protein